MRKVAVFVSILLASVSVRAVVVSDYAAATNAPTGSWDVDWSHVHKYKNSSAVAVGPYWLLTAAHVADDTSGTAGYSNVVVNGVTYYPQEIIFHSAGQDPDNANKADLALVRFDKEFPGWYPLYTGNFPSTPSSKRLNAVLVGYGRTGTVYSAYWIAASSGNGVKRWGTQKIDGSLTLVYNGGGVVGVSTNIGFRMDFSQTDTSYEAGLAIYDSGGGTFVNDGGVWKLAGINTIVYRAYVATPTNGLDRIFSISMPAYQAWVTGVINPDGDLDGDGIPNWWEQQFGATTGLVASADNDSDGFTNYEEWLADTDPTGAASFFENTGLFSLTDQTFYFTGSTARQYQVFYTTNDLATTNLTWIAAHTNKVRGSGTNSSITVTNVADAAFYRLWVFLP